MIEMIVLMNLICGSICFNSVSLDSGLPHDAEDYDRDVYEEYNMSRGRLQDIPQETLHDG